MNDRTWWKRQASHGAVNTMCLASIDGSDVIITGGDDRTIRYWDPTTGTELMRLVGHDQSVTHLAVGRVGSRTYLVSATDFHDQIRIWDATSGNQMHALRVQDHPVTALSIGTLEGKSVLMTGAAQGEGPVRLWDLEEPQLIAKLAGHTGPVAALGELTVRGRLTPAAAIRLPHTYLGRRNRDTDRLFLWDILTETQLATLEDPDGIGSVRFVTSDTTELVLTSDDKGNIHAWHPKDGKKSHRIGDFSSPVVAMEVGTIDKREKLVAIENSGRASVWDIQSITREAVLSGMSSEVSSIALGHVQGRPCLATADEDLSTSVWDLELERRTTNLVGHSGSVRAVTVWGSGRHRRIITGGRDGALRVWHPDSGDLESTIETLSSVSALTTTWIDGHLRVISAGGNDRTVRVWDIDAGHQLASHEVRLWGADNMVAVPADDRKSLLVSSRSSGLVVELDLRTGKKLRSFDAHTGTIWGMSVSNRAGVDYVVSASGGEPAVRIWEARSHEDLVELQDQPNHAYSASAGWANGQLCVVAGGLSGAHLWVGATGRLMRAERRIKMATCVRFARLGGEDCVLIGDGDGLIHVWAADTGEDLRRPIPTHSSTILDMAVSDDVLVSVGHDGYVALQDVHGGPQARRPHTALPNDSATERDTLGGGPRLVAAAIAQFLTDPDARPPMTIGVKGSWGSGKSSVMSMVRQNIDPLDPPVHVLGQSGSRRLPLRLTTPPTQRVLSRMVVRVFRQPRELSIGEALQQRRQRVEDTAAPPSASYDWRPTVWFNPWHHQSVDEVWAGLATTITEQVTSRLTNLDRERFFFKLNMARVDRDALRRSVLSAILLRAASPLALLAVFFSLIAAIWGIQWAVGGFSAASLMAIIATAASLLRSPLSTIDPKLVRNPVTSDLFQSEASPIAAFHESDHRGRLGYPYLAYVDLKRVVDLVATPERPLIVFIDDLDRCSSSTVVKTLEALNLFLAGPFSNCSFVIAVEPTALASHVASEYQALADVVSDSTDSSRRAVGWRFLEKMIHLPVNIPRPTSQQIDEYVESLLPPRRESPSHLEADLEILGAAGAPHQNHDHLDGRRSRLRQGISRDKRRAVGKAPADPTIEPNARHESQHVTARDHLLDRPETPPFSSMNLANSDAYREGCAWAARVLIADGNPRQIKRLLALTHLYVLIATRLDLLTVHDSDALTAEIQEVAVLAALNVRWPEHVDWLLARADETNELLMIELMRDGSVVGDGVDVTTGVDWQALPGQLSRFIATHKDRLGMVVRLTTLAR